jgi:hypothetical protein
MCTFDQTRKQKLQICVDVLKKVFGPICEEAGLVQAEYYGARDPGPAGHDWRNFAAATRNRRKARDALRAVRERKKVKEATAEDVKEAEKLAVEKEKVWQDKYKKVKQR